MTMDWMIVEPSLEQRLTLECTCRGISEATDLREVQALCIALTRQNWHQGMILKQAVQHIAQLDSWDLEQAA
jgi:hypothetical protein